MTGLGETPSLTLSQTLRRNKQAISRYALRRSALAVDVADLEAIVRRERPFGVEADVNGNQKVARPSLPMNWDNACAYLHKCAMPSA